MSNDLTLLRDTILEAGDIARGFWREGAQVWDKGHGAGPVTEADLAVDDHVKSRLMAARPQFGWLSEETEDTPARLDQDQVFIVDPIDGTRSFVAGEKTWAISLAVVTSGKPTAAAIYLPVHDKLYLAATGKGATLNDRAISASATTAIDGATVLAARPNFDARNWHHGTPPLARHFRSSLAYRLALVAEGAFDAMLTLRPTWEWDVAAGHLIAHEAGAIVSDQNGQPARFNNPTPKIDGMLAAAGGVHQGILGQLANSASGA